MQNLIAQVYAWSAAHWLFAALIALYIVLQFAYGRRSQIDAWCEKRPRVAGVLKILRGLGVDPWLIIQGLTLLTKGRLPVGYVSLAEKILKLLATGALVLLATGCVKTTVLTADSSDGKHWQLCLEFTESVGPVQAWQLACGDARFMTLEQLEQQTLREHPKAIMVREARK